MAVTVDTDTCIGCGACASECPTGAITVPGATAEVDAGTCIDCGVCVGECPVEALSL